ncbi:MAG TPA: sensor domain-containing diguanylate cyclase [Patescibacteria group bacterium]|nr:sensor domain-containing diguanylate cyclase [Patescibacteria group bacterium]
MINAESLRALLESISDGGYIVDKSRNILFWNKAAEAISGFAASEMTGRNCADNMIHHIDERGVNLCQESCPLLKSIADGLIRESQLYMHHKDGHQVPVIIRTVPYRDQKNEVVGAIELFRKNVPPVGPDAEKLKILANMAYVDQLTELPNRQYAENKLKLAMTEMARSGLTPGVLLMGVVGFKEINDRHGNIAGDKVLQMVAKTIAANTEHLEIGVRWQGSRFMVISMNTKKSLLMLLSNKLKVMIEQFNLVVNGEAVAVRMAVGATVAVPGETVSTLVIRAEDLMRQSEITENHAVKTDADVM